MTKRPDFDVVVAGAGAGGAAAAYYLTGAGLRVLAVDKARLPRYKACGGAVPRQVLDRFPFAFDAVIRAAPAKARVTMPGQPSVDLPLPDRPVVMVKRSDFDAFLLARSGAEVLEGQAVTGVTETQDLVQVSLGERKLTARYLVGADGATSQVARSLGLRRKRKLGGTLEGEVPLNGNGRLRAAYGSRAIFSLRVVPWGYAWVFPKDAVLSVGICQLRPGYSDLRGALEREMARLGIGLAGVKLRGHPLPCYRTRPWPLWRGQPQEKLSTRRCLLVGDAAGLVDPLVGEGIRYAMASARLAAEAIVCDDLSGYEAAVWRGIGHDLATAGLAARLFYRWPEGCYQVGLRNPATLRHLVDLLAGRASYQGLGRRLIATTAGWLLNNQRKSNHGSRRENGKSPRFPRR